MKARYLAAVALAPLVLAAPALAQTAPSTTITGTRTTPVQTSTAANGQPSDVIVDAGATVAPTAASTAAITIDSNNTVLNRGVISYNDLNDVTGVLIRGGFTGGFTNTGAINVLEGYTATDADGDGDLDGPFAQGARRFGVRLTGPGAFTGPILNGQGNQINIEGVDSAAISIESALNGSITNQGALFVLGDRGRALATRAAVSGNISLLGTVGAQGAGSTAVDIAGAVGGVLQLQGAISATGYRFTSRPARPEDRARLDADDLLQGGSAVRVAANVAGGIVVDAPPPDLSTTDTDEDDDTILDANETTGVIRVFGQAPALDIGSASAPVTIGVAGTGDNAYGLIVRGQVAADGVYDGVSGTAVRIGQSAANPATVQGGVRIAANAAVAASASSADAQGLQVAAGGATPTIVNAGEITANILSEGANRAAAVDIAQGGSVTSLRNDGLISAQVFGERGAAVAVSDRSGALSSIENRGRVVALITANDDSTDTDDPNSDPSDEVITGSEVAFDLAANTTGVTLRQTGIASTGTGFADADGDGVQDDDEPSIIGDIRFGSGNDTLDALNGVVVGDIAFGAGADTLTIAGGAAVVGAVSDSDGRLAVDVRNGSLTLTNAAALNATSVNVGADGALSVTADPRAGTAGAIRASGAVTVANGAQVGLRLASLQRGTREYAVLSGSSLSVGALDAASLADAPFLYVINPRVDQAANTLLISVRPRTVEELGFNRSEAEAYDGVFNALDLSPRIERAFLNQTTREGLVRLYDQLLPDHSGGALLSLSAVNDAISNVLDSRTDPRGRAGPNGAWAQEIFFNLRHDRDQALGFESQGFGVTGGFEGIGPDNGAIGVTASFVTADFEDTDAGVGEQVSLSMFELGAYWRRYFGRLRLDARGAAGVVLFDSDRRFLSPTDNLALTTSAEWTGYSASGHLGASYEVGTRFYARPFVALDALYLSEGSYEESGGGTGFDLSVDSRSGSHITATGGLTAGARFGREFWWGPEATVAYRASIAGDPGTTTARFRNSTGTAFTLTGEDVDGGGIQIRVALRAGSPRGYIALESGAEVDDAYERYDIRLVVRAFF